MARLAAWGWFRAVPDSPARFWARQAQNGPAADRAILAQPAIRALLVESTKEAFRSGTLGFAWDAAVLTRPWGFAVADIHVPVHVWQGEQDPLVPVATGRYFADTIPHYQATFYPDEGHLIMYTHWPEILECLVADACWQAPLW